MKLTLMRVSLAEVATYGVLIHEHIPFALSLERPWLNNQRGKSCIPIGEYTCERVISPHFGNTFEVTNVQDRKHILFHKGNLADDSHGCILVGEAFNPVNGEPGITASADGYNEFMRLLKDVNQFQLSIKEVENV